MQPVFTTEEFLALSAALHYQLAGDPINWRALTAQVLPRRLPVREEGLLLDTLQYLHDAYGETRRRLGPAAILHPIRVMAILDRTVEGAPPMERMAALLHDKLEDLQESKFDAGRWGDLEQRYRELLERLPDRDAHWLNDAIEVHTKSSDEPYHAYLGRILERAREAPELVRLKLADRLDNTYDLRVDLWDRSTAVDGFRQVFEALFATRTQIEDVETAHHVPGKINGAHRLYQLSKNAVFLSLLRQDGLDLVGSATRRLFAALSVASVEESSRILLHLFTYHVRDPELQREVLVEVMEYTQRGSIERVTALDVRHPLDGLFSERFDAPDKAHLVRQLADLYDDKLLMAKVAVVFAAIFSSFRNDPTYRIRGIDSDGFHTQTG